MTGIPDIGAYRPYVLPSPRIFARMAAQANETRVEESLRQVRACLAAETIVALVDAAISQDRPAGTEEAA